MAEKEPVARYEYASGCLEQALEFLKRTRSELRTLQRAKVWTDRFQVLDVNGDYFEITGVGYPDPSIVPLLEAVQATFKPESIHQPAPGSFKEFRSSRRYPWAADRVM